MSRGPQRMDGPAILHYNGNFPELLAPSYLLRFSEAPLAWRTMHLLLIEPTDSPPSSVTRCDPFTVSCDICSGHCCIIDYSCSNKDLGIHSGEMRCKGKDYCSRRQQGTSLRFPEAALMTWRWRGAGTVSEVLQVTLHNTHVSEAGDEYIGLIHSDDMRVGSQRSLKMGAPIRLIMSITSRSVLSVANCVTHKAFKLTEPQYLSKILWYVDDVSQLVIRGQLRDSQGFQTHGALVPE
ncbi:hypothetical protein J6590_009883 [Homalodisca vitripennis]|nr:hypothetical protein J6590_009883 [Homalodisca vitripennis]